MATNDTTLSATITAGFSGLNSAFAAARNEVKSGCDGIKASMEGLQKPFELVNGWMLAFTALAGGGFGLGEMVKETVGAELSVNKLAHTFGETLDEASATRAELVRLGISTDEYTTAALKLDRQIKQNEAGITAMGVATRDSGGNLLNQQELMNNAIQALARYKEGADRNSAAMVLFGRGVGDINNLLRLNADAMKQAQQDVKDLDLGVTPEKVQSARDYQAAMGELTLTFESIKEHIVEAVLPALTDFANWFRSNGPEAIKIAQGVIEDFSNFLNTYLVPIFRAVWENVSYLGGVLLKSVGGWETVKAVINGVAVVIRDVLIIAMTELVGFISAAVISIRTAWDAIAETVVAAVEYIKTEIGSWATIMADVASGQWAKAKTDYEAGARDVANILQRYTTVMRKVGTDWSDAMHQGMAERNAIYNGPGGIFGPPAQTTTKKASTSNEPVQGNQNFTPYDKKAGEEAIKAAEEEAKAHERVTQIEIQDKEQAVQQMRALDQISVADEIAQLTALENQRYDLIHAELEKELELVRNKPAEYAKVNGQIEVAEAQHQAKLNEIGRKGVSEQVSYLKQAWAPITDTFNSAFESMLKGQATFWGAMKKGLQDFLVQSIMANLKRLENWILVEVAQTKATETGVAGRNAAGAAEGQTGLFTHISNALKSIMADAAQAYADVFAWASPEMGPFAVIPAAGAFAAVAAMQALVPSFAVGAWELPGDMLAQVHAGEMIIPAGPAGAIRNAVSGNGSASSGGAGSSRGGDTHVWNIQAFDRRDVERVLTRHIDAVTSTLKTGQNRLKLPRAYAV